MPTLEELLRASLKGANEKFDQANKDLHASVVEAAKAVEAVTGGSATLRLIESDRSEHSTRYDLVVSLRSATQSRRVAILSLTKAGYPVERLEENAREGWFTIAERFESSEKLSAYFKKLASDTDSPLVAYLAYIIRNPQE